MSNDVLQRVGATGADEGAKGEDNSMNNEINICCPKCKGKGQIKIPRHLADTLEFIQERGVATSADVHEELMPESGTNGAANRLANLEKMGLIYRADTSDKQIHWKVKREVPS